MEIHMFCSSDGNTPMKIPATQGYNTDVAGSPIISPTKNCSVGHRICGVRTQISNDKGLEGVEFACCTSYTLFFYENNYFLRCGQLYVKMVLGTIQGSLNQTR